MNIQELADRIDELIRQADDDIRCVYMIGSTITPNDAIAGGNGCPACAARAFAEGVESGEFKHYHEEEMRIH